MRWRFPVLILAAVLTTGCISGTPVVEPAAGSGPPGASAASRVTVSGISSGAHLATQLHVARPDLFSGAALLAGGPWGCAAGSLTTALGRCMAQPGKGIPVDELEAVLRRAAAEGRVGDPAELADDPVWIYRGADDAVIGPHVTTAAHELALRFADPRGVALVDDVAAGHVFPTVEAGGSCAAPASPWIGACGFDAAGALLTHLHGPLEPPLTGDPTGELVALPVEAAEEASLLGEAWLFVPEGCPATGGGCDLHVALHGCLQSAELVERAFVETAGYLPWAAANRIRILFPQARSGPANPLGCWDWWGFTGPDFADRDGPQIRVVAGLVDRVLAH